MIRRALVLAAIGLQAAMAAPSSAQTAPTPVRDALTVQKARNAFVAAQMAKHYYEPGRFDLGDLPGYRPRRQVTGPIRVWASDMWGNAGFQGRLAAAFRRFQPGASLVFTGISPSGSFAGLLTGDADVAIARRMTWVDLLSFQRRFDHDPLVITGMTGWAVDPPFVVAVNKDNPLASVSMAELDGIFGAERSGGWQGTTWHPEYARGPEGNIRRWGQLGLTGAWAARPIRPFGYNLQYLFAPRFSETVLRGSGQWNERLRQFTISATADGKLSSVDQQMADALARDRDAIAYYSPLRGIEPNTRAVPIRLADGPLVAATIEAVRDRSYPLWDAMWIYANPDKAGHLSPAVGEFLHFVLSREAQEEVNRDTTMLPLTAAIVAEQRRTLEEAEAR